MISCAAEERERISHVHTRTDHLLLGIIRGGGSVAAFLQGPGITAEGALQKLIHQRSACLAGVREAQGGNRRHTAATGETTDYARACHRAFDSQQRCRLG